MLSSLLHFMCSRISNHGQHGAGGFKPLLQVLLTPPQHAQQACGLHPPAATKEACACCLQAPRGQATACCKLGVLYHQKGKLDQAVSYFERFYELARSLGM